MAGSDTLFSYMYADEARCVRELLLALDWPASMAHGVQQRAADLVRTVRAAKRKTGELESFLQQYGLNSEEGLALMTLAEALLRIPDAHTANLLIRDKIAAADWLSKQGGSNDLMVKAAGFGLGLVRKTLDSAASRLGEPVIRAAIIQAMRMLGKQFVLGRDIEEGVKNARDYQKKGYRMSYDMLGEGARTMEDAQRYFEAYKEALIYIGQTAQGETIAERPGLSVKLSALHPRYEYRRRSECVPQLTMKLTELARIAANANIALTVDAEEADRLMLSLEIIGAVARDAKTAGWEGFGLAIQAYSKRAYALIDELEELARAANRRLQVRLVKGAYWDTEVKRAQVLGLSEYPVFTRKCNTDLSWIACARKLMDRRDVFYPMLATHNAHSVAAVMEMAGSGDKSSFEFQRLHGMGETLHDIVVKEARVAVYAPCGSHEDLLAYLVRRLLENGANSSFVNQLLDADTPVEAIVKDPVEKARSHDLMRHPLIPLPHNLYGLERPNSKGMDLTQAEIVQPLLQQMAGFDGQAREALPVIGGKMLHDGAKSDVRNPAETAQTVGFMRETPEADIAAAFVAAKKGFAAWSAQDAEQRAAVLDSLASLMEDNCAELMALCVREAGKTLDDALAEVREAVDFCRYYAARGRKDFARQTLPGPTGERNVLELSGRGVFVCISPWNFPLAIFTGQIAAALMAGNAVIAKPAEQTPLIAAKFTKLLLQAGLPADAFALGPGDGKIGAALVAHPDVAGVAFTGSTEVARLINRTLAAKDGPIVPLIAETGGQNAMVVDSSALPEQVIDDVILSAFGSTGQRCSALRVLYVQEDVADKMLHMLKGAMALRKCGDPMDLATDSGPVIDEEAREKLRQHRRRLENEAKFIAEVPLDPAFANKGTFFAPCAFEIPDIGFLSGEVFGPVLHVIRFKSAEIDDVLRQINSTGYGLTLGVHSRIGSTLNRIAEDAHVGNAYINRSMIGAVVGVQPFGGHGLSGTGPKAGGPHYLARFANEKVISIDTARAGGNPALLSLEEN
jgi:RHH-type proline utilization regulon transcriptional repressor/proline dehydrogenase/delta 1-pyrroline-5-carboxylate dehydrogenase